MPGKGGIALTLAGHSTQQVCGRWNPKAPKHWAEVHTHLQVTPCQLHIGKGQKRACHPPAVAYTHISHHTLVQIQCQERPAARCPKAPVWERQGSYEGLEKVERSRAEASRTSQGDGGSTCQQRANSSGQPTSETAGPLGCAQSFHPRQRLPPEAG